MKSIFVILALLLMSGCVSIPEYSREEYLAFTTHEFPGKSADEVIEAAEMLLRLADKKDVAFTYKPEDSGLIARRKWFVYMLVAAGGGVYNFDLTTRETEDGTLSYLAIGSVGHSVMPSGIVMDGGMGVGVDSSSTPSVPLTSLHMPTYTLFWSRMDFLLGLTDDWFTCQHFREEESKSVTSLCEFADDDMPEMTHNQSKFFCDSFKAELRELEEADKYKELSKRNELRIQIQKICRV